MAKKKTITKTEQESTLPRFRTNYTRDPNPGESGFGKTMTQPGQAQTVKQIFKRALTGGLIAGTFEPRYLDADNESDLPLPRPGMEPDEIAQYSKDLAQYVKGLEDENNVKRAKHTKEEIEAIKDDAPTENVTNQNDANKDSAKSAES